MYKRLLAGMMALTITLSSVLPAGNVYAGEPANTTTEMISEAMEKAEPTETIGTEAVEDEKPTGTETVNETESEKPVETGKTENGEAIKPAETGSAEAVNGTEVTGPAEETEPSETEEAGEPEEAEATETEEAGKPEELEETETTETERMDIESDELSVRGTNSFGTLLADEMTQKITEQEENNGCNVFSVEVTGTQAVVSFETVEDCTLVVGIYDEAGVGMLAAGSLEVFRGETQAVVDIETDSMPQYFYLRAFLVESGTLRPLGTSYESPNYTKEMQDFFAMTTDDFDAERVLNLDEDKTNNFAVYSDETIIIPQSAGENEVVSTDDANGCYVIENANADITSLQTGDIFAYEYGADETMIVKVDSVVMDGTTATIAGAPLEAEEAFEFVKIDVDAGVDEAVIDPSVCSDGVTYEGLVDYEDEGEAQTYGARKIEDTIKTAVSAKIDFHDGALKVTGGVEFDVSTTFKFYNTPSYQYIELRGDSSMKVAITITGKGKLEKSLPSLKLKPVPGIQIGYNPAFVVEAGASLEFSGKIKQTIGFAIDSDIGMKSLDSIPKIETECKLEGKIFVGLKLEPKVEVKILTVTVAEAGLEGCIGFEMTGQVTEWRYSSDDAIHDCGLECISGEIFAKGEVSIKVKMAKWNYEWKVLAIKSKVGDWYWSFTYGERHLTPCPHLKYKTTITVTDLAGNPLEGICVESPFTVKGDKGLEDVDSLTTDENGTAEGYLSAEKHTLTVSKDGTRYATKRITIVDDAKEVVICIDASGSGSGGIAGGGSGGGGGDALNPIPPVQEENTGDAGKVKMVSLGEHHSGIVTQGGSLYMWGINNCGQLGNGSTKNSRIPVKIMDDVTSVSLAGLHSGAITKDGSLYMWGNNDYGQLGNGTTEDSSVPVKIMDDVVSVSLGGYHSGAITKDGSLYMWGSNEYGQLGNGTVKDSRMPVKIMDNVVFVSLGWDYSGAITKDGSLYMWGSNYYGQLGNGTMENSSVPVKIINNVASMSLGGGHSGAIMEDGSLYVWGYGYAGQLGNGTKLDSNVPVKIMNDVIAMSLGAFHSGVVKKDGSLYMWGNNLSGQLGNGTTTDSNVPIKIMNDVISLDLGETCSGTVKKDGSLYMWGSNYAGQLGNGATTDSLIPIPIQIPPATRAADSGAAAYSMYALEEESIFLLRAADISTASPAEQKTATFQNLVPNDTYNFYVTKSLTAEQLLSPDNLLYISQGIADSAGTLAMTYQQREVYEDAEVFVIGSAQRDLSNATITVSDVNYTGNGQVVFPTVTYQGSTLVLDRDYELTGGFRVNAPGTYTMELAGIGTYAGTASATYQVVCAHSYTAQVTKQPTAAEEGEMTYTCMLCGYSYTEAIGKLPQGVEGDVSTDSGDNTGDAETNSSQSGNNRPEAGLPAIVAAGTAGNPNDDNQIVNRFIAPWTNDNSKDNSREDVKLSQTGTESMDNTVLWTTLTCTICGAGALFCIDRKRRKKNQG